MLFGNCSDSKRNFPVEFAGPAPGSMFRLTVTWADGSRFCYLLLRQYYCNGQSLASERYRIALFSLREEERRFL